MGKDAGAWLAALTLVSLVLAGCGTFELEEPGPARAPGSAALPADSELQAQFQRTERLRWSISDLPAGADWVLFEMVQTQPGVVSAGLSAEFQVSRSPEEEGYGPGTDPDPCYLFGVGVVLPWIISDGETVVGSTEASGPVVRQDAVGGATLGLTSVVALGTDELRRIPVVLGLDEAEAWSDRGARFEATVGAANGSKDVEFHWRVAASGTMTCATSNWDYEGGELTETPLHVQAVSRSRAVESTAGTVLWTFGQANRELHVRVETPNGTAFSLERSGLQSMAKFSEIVHETAPGRSVVHVEELVGVRTNDFGLPDPGVGLRVRFLAVEDLPAWAVHESSHWAAELEDLGEA